MDKKEFMKAFLTGVCSIFPFFDGFPEFRGVDVEKKLVKSVKSAVPEIKVELVPVFKEVGRCFDSAGALIREAMETTGDKQG